MGTRRAQQPITPLEQPIEGVPLEQCIAMAEQIIALVEQRIAHSSNPSLWSSSVGPLHAAMR